MSDTASRSGLALLAADTLRSRAYAQALVAAGVNVERALIVRSPQNRRWGQAQRVPDRPAALGAATKTLDRRPVDEPTDLTTQGRLRSSNELFIPDLSTPLFDSVQRLAGSVETSDSGTLNASEVVSWIGRSQLRLVVFSGFGGEVIRPDILAAGAPLLHMHAGWLPQYRGSTTVYYSYLKERCFGVSAILLSSTLDAGPIVGRRRYAPPPPGTDVDFYYDSAVRADLLVDVVKQWLQKGAFPFRIEQSTDEGTTYYIIHPLLKHVALNSLHRKSPERE